MELWSMEAERRRRLAAATNGAGGAATVRERDLPGGFGDTPGFTYREHLEEVLVHGSPPTSLLRRLVLS
jgi:hypothetical protein